MLAEIIRRTHEGHLEQRAARRVERRRCRCLPGLPPAPPPPMAVLVAAPAAAGWRAMMPSLSCRSLSRVKFLHQIRNSNAGTGWRHVDREDVVAAAERRRTAARVKPAARPGCRSRRCWFVS